MGRIVKENIDFKRGQDSKRALRVGSFVPGTMKEFEDVEVGDKTLDYGEQEGTVVAKIKTPYYPFADGWGPDEDKHDPGQYFVERYDSTGAGSEIFTDEEMSPVEPGQDIELIATEDLDGNGPYVFTYGGEGAYAVWE